MLIRKVMIQTSFHPYIPCGHLLLPTAGNKVKKYYKPALNLLLLCDVPRKSSILLNKEEHCLNSVLAFIYLHYSRFCGFNKGVNTFIQQGCINQKLNSKDIF